MSSLAAPRTLPAGREVDTFTEAFLAEKLALAAHSGEPTWIALPAPVAPVEQLLEASNLGDGAVWDPPGGTAFAGVGAAWKIQLQGPNRFTDLRTEATAVLGSLRREQHPDVFPFEPRVLGGLAFDVGAADEAPWEAFGDGCFTLPRYLYAVDGDRALLALVVRGDELRSDARRVDARCQAWVDETRGLLRRLDAAAGVETLAVPSPWPQEAPDPEPSVEDPDWIRRVQDIREAIERGEVEKIVAARRSVVPVPAGRSVPEVLGLLGRNLRASTRFAFCRPRSAFVGVTPERLLAKQGSTIRTEALAGSIERGHAAELLDSGKDRLEQQLVVDSIVRRLEPLCDRLQVAARPAVRELRDVLHLHTPISGRLSEPRHILEVAELLHPTPAVGGVPTPEALRWISERETHPRGWYSAPVGWFDARGDGELAVALRSCVLTEGKAYLFVGAGIVADSDPELELRETELKKQALFSVIRG